MYEKYFWLLIAVEIEGKWEIKEKCYFKHPFEARHDLIKFYGEGKVCVKNWKPITEEEYLLWWQLVDIRKGENH